jgi:hypothetical protein
LDWIEAEFGMSHKTAMRFMHVAEHFGGRVDIMSTLKPTVLYDKDVGTVCGSHDSEELPMAASCCKTARGRQSRDGYQLRNRRWRDEIGSSGPAMRVHFSSTNRNPYSTIRLYP